MKQLSLEETATKYGELNGQMGTMEPLSSAFEAGAKWQKEQFKNELHKINGLQVWIEDPAMKKLFIEFIKKHVTS